MLSKLTPDISEELLRHLRSEGLNINTGLTFNAVTQENGRVKIHAEKFGETKLFEAETLVVATGIKPNTNQLGIDNIALKLT